LVKIHYICAAFIELGMDYATIAILAGTVLSTVSVLLGAKYTKGKSKAKQLVALLGEIIEAAQDDKVSEEEFQQIVTSTKKILSGEPEE
jgi:hypothetical protein